MFLDPLRVFHETVRQKSIRKAGEALSLAPSSVSRQISILERQVGTKLLERASTGVTLTHAGRLIVEFAESVLIDYDSLRADLDDHKGQRRGLIRIGSVQSVVATLTVQAVDAFRKRFPDVEFHIKVLHAKEVLEAVRHGDIDVGASFCPEPDAMLASIARIQEPIVAAIPHGNPLFGRDVVSIEELSKTALAVPDRNFGVRAILDRAFHAAGMPLNPAMSSNTFSPLREAACIAGMIALLPRSSMMQDGAPSFKVAKIANDEVNAAFVEFLVLRDRRQSMILRHFVSELKRLTRTWQSAME